MSIQSQNPDVFYSRLEYKEFWSEKDKISISGVQWKSRINYHFIKVVNQIEKLRNWASFEKLITKRYQDKDQAHEQAEIPGLAQNLWRSWYEVSPYNVHNENEQKYDEW